MLSQEATALCDLPQCHSQRVSDTFPQGHIWWTGYPAPGAGRMGATAASLSNEVSLSFLRRKPLKAPRRLSPVSHRPEPGPMATPDSHWLWGMGWLGLPRPFKIGPCGECVTPSPEIRLLLGGRKADAYWGDNAGGGPCLFLELGDDKAPYLCLFFKPSRCLGEQLVASNHISQMGKCWIREAGLT